MDNYALALQLHQQYHGKIGMHLLDHGTIDRAKLSAYYSPGVGAVCLDIAAHPEHLPQYTWTNHLVAVISDGSAVLGLGNLGPKAAMPVMEGKALLFKHFADLDSIPIVLDVHTPDEIVDTIKAMAPSFGAINLEDIAAPQCFEIEDRLKAECDIPVFHDDQHGTAIVTLAGLLNACTVTGRRLQDCRTVIIGAGAAGTAITKLLHLAGMRHLTAVDSKGTLGSYRTDLSPSKQALLAYVNDAPAGTLADALASADVFVGVSVAGLLTAEHIRSMAPDPIIFALANPDPEIMPDDAHAAGAAVVATGRSDFPNQVNNALAFPGIFKGALHHGVRQITDTHKLAAAHALANLVEHPTPDRVIPWVGDDHVVEAVAAVITPDDVAEIAPAA